MQKSNASEQFQESLKEAFIDFVSHIPSCEWKSADYARIKKIIGRHDPQARFLKDQADQFLFEKISQEYAESSVRMYMLNSSRFIREQDLKKRILLSYFENDANETVKEVALVKLAIHGWEHALRHAIELWNTDITEKRMVALNVFEILKPPNFNNYFLDALNSKDDGLRIYAEATVKMRENLAHRDEWETLSE